MCVVQNTRRCDAHQVTCTRSSRAANASSTPCSAERTEQGGFHARGSACGLGQTPPSADANSVDASVISHHLHAMQICVCVCACVCACVCICMLVCLRARANVFACECAQAPARGELRGDDVRDAPLPHACDCGRTAARRTWRERCGRADWRGDRHRRCHHPRDSGRRRVDVAVRDAAAVEMQIEGGGVARA